MRVHRQLGQRRLHPERRHQLGPYPPLGYGSGSSGTYTLGPAGSLSVTGFEDIGYSGSGAFTQTAGTNTVTDSLYLGYNTGASGTYTLSGTGSLSSGSEYVGYNGSGSFTQSGGTNSVTDTLALGYGSGQRHL